MGLISANTIIVSLALFHLTLGFFFLTNPASIAEQSLVFVIGNAMGMAPTSGFDVPSPALAFLAVALATIGITDIVTLSLPEEVGMVHYWGTQAPVRVLVSMVSVFYTFFFSDSRWHGKRGGGSSSSSSFDSAYTTGGDLLKNRVFFTFMFLELVSWFWLWVTLREEHAEMLRRQARRAEMFN